MHPQAQQRSLLEDTAGSVLEAGAQGPRGIEPMRPDNIEVGS